jgi:hypothetical protein
LAKKHEHTYTSAEEGEELAAGEGEPKDYTSLEAKIEGRIRKKGVFLLKYVHPAVEVTKEKDAPVESAAEEAEEALALVEEAEEAEEARMRRKMIMRKKI